MDTDFYLRWNKVDVTLVLWSSQDTTIQDMTWHLLESCINPFISTSCSRNRLITVHMLSSLVNINWKSSTWLPVRLSSHNEAFRLSPLCNSVMEAAFNSHLLRLRVHIAQPSCRPKQNTTSCFIICTRI